MKKREEFDNKIRKLCVYLRNEMDKFAGVKLPDDFKKEFIDYCEDPFWRKKIFQGTEFSKTFRNVLRPDREEQLRQVLEEAGFFK